MKYPEHCGCQPGSPENGWHQIWSKGCRQIELDIWSETMESANRIIRVVNSKEPAPLIYVTDNSRRLRTS